MDHYCVEDHYLRKSKSHYVAMATGKRRKEQNDKANIATEALSKLILKKIQLYELKCFCFPFFVWRNVHDKV